MSARVATIAVALVALAWLGVMERNTRLQAEGVEAAGERDVARADGDFRAARLLNPDTLPDIRRAFLFQGSGRSEDAVAVLEDVVRREPENVNAWGLLLAVARDADPAAAERAQEALRGLDPVNARDR